MAKVRRLEGFDRVFQDATEAALRFHQAGRRVDEDGTLIRIKCETIGQQMNTQMQFRQYWQALGLALRNGQITEVDPRWTIASLAGELSTRANKKDKKVAEIIHRSSLSVSRGIAKTLNSIAATIAASPDLAANAASRNDEARKDTPELIAALDRAIAPPVPQDQLLEENYTGTGTSKGGGGGE